MPILSAERPGRIQEMLYYNIEKTVFQGCMSRPELLKSDQIDPFLHKAVQDGLCGTLSCLHSGKWSVFDIVVDSFRSSGLRVQIISENLREVDIKKNQPVGICFQFERYKYIFESIIDQPPTVERPMELTIETPDKIEKMQRRAYERQPIPSSLNIRAMFWHRGYHNDSNPTPDEDYWQGKLENLSAGGAMIRVGQDHRNFFSMGQLVGVQFTPMSYQKPLLLEGHVRHLQTQADQEALLVGVEFLGLEASPEGRDTLHRLLEVIDRYEQMNKSTDGNSR
jgi:c-di-GMP-binding flagellar brake protein YcgR